MARKPAGRGGDGRDLAPDENEKAILEAERVQLLSVMARLGVQYNKVLASKAELATEQEVLTEIFNSAKASSKTFTRQRLMRYLTDQRAQARDLVEEAQIQRRHRDWLGFPDGAETLNIFDDANTPQSVKDEATWRAEGYMAYHRNEQCKPDEKVSDPPAWMKGWHDAETATAYAMGKVAEEAV